MHARRPTCPCMCDTCSCSPAHCPNSIQSKNPMYQQHPHPCVRTVERFSCICIALLLGMTKEPSVWSALPRKLLGPLEYTIEGFLWQLHIPNRFHPLLALWSNAVFSRVGSNAQSLVRRDASRNEWSEVTSFCFSSNLRFLVMSPP